MRSRVRVSRFAAECRIWAQLGEHPNIVRAHSVEIIDGRPYVVLELVQGGDLHRWIGTPRLDLPQALRFGYQFCVGMEHALRQGLHCHRDIKPGNLLVTEKGTLKITDFGLARAARRWWPFRPELPDGSIPLAEPDDPAADHLHRSPRLGIRPARRPGAPTGRPMASRRPEPPSSHHRGSSQSARPGAERRRPSTVTAETEAHDETTPLG